MSCAVSSSDVAKELENIELKKRLTIRGAEVFIQEPSLPQREVAPKRSMVVLLAFLLSSFVFVIFVFVRKAVLVANQDATASKKS